MFSQLKRYDECNMFARIYVDYIFYRSTNGGDIEHQCARIYEIIIGYKVTVFVNNVFY